MTNALASMTNNVNVGIDEVVSIFVSRYETDLYSKKDVLSGRIRSLKADVAKIESDLIKTVDKSDYEASVPQFGLSFKVDSVEVRFETDGYARNKVGVTVDVGMYDKASDRSYAVYTKTITLPINPQIIADRKALNQELETVNAELLEVMGLIKSVGRKERQIRGKIAEMKMEEAGKSDLLNNDNLTKLIALS